MKIYREITPVTSADVYVILDSVNNGFDYPMHNHPEYEINLVLGASGQRVVGDSTETYHNADLALIGPYLFHKWDDSITCGTAESPCRVITIQFDMHLFESAFLSRRPFYLLKELLHQAHRGIMFSGETLSQARALMIRMTDHSGIQGIALFLQLLDLLSKSTEIHALASEGFESGALQSPSKRLHAAYQYIILNFARTDLSLKEVAAAVNLSSSAFSHFFKKCTHKSFTEFLIAMRLGYACKLLINTDDLIGQICSQAGYNNTANFNRLFKKYHGCTPYIFRKRYQEKNTFDWLDQHTPGQFLPSDSELQHVPKPNEYATRIVYN